MVLISVEGGHRAVIFDRFQGVKPEVTGEGTHFLIPWVQRPIIFDIRSRPRNVPVITGSKGTLFICFKKHLNELSMRRCWIEHRKWCFGVSRVTISILCTPTGNSWITASSQYTHLDEKVMLGNEEGTVCSVGCGWRQWIRGCVWALLDLCTAALFPGFSPTHPGEWGYVDRRQTSESNNLSKIPLGEYTPLVEYWLLKSLIQLESFDPFILKIDQTQILWGKAIPRLWLYCTSQTECVLKNLFLWRQQKIEFISKKDFCLTDLQNVNITLRILFRPQPQVLPNMYMNLGEDYDERVLPSITTEVLKAVVVGHNVLVYFNFQTTLSSPG